MKQYLIGFFILLILVILIVFPAFFAMHSQRIKADKELEKVRIIQQEKTKRTKERWSFLPNWRKDGN